nr:hypothetical protein CFP56_42872 [Quercus suber]
MTLGSHSIESVSVLCQCGIGGVCSYCWINPFDLLQTILASQGEPKRKIERESSRISTVVFWVCVLIRVPKTDFFWTVWNCLAGTSFHFLPGNQFVNCFAY